jgi:hypothetical protein
MIKIIVQSSPFVWKSLIMFDLTKRGPKDENVKLEKKKKWSWACKEDEKNSKLWCNTNE